MTESQRRQYTWEFKQQLVERYGRKEVTAAQLASEYNLHPHTMYQWKYELEQRRKKLREKELSNAGRSPEDIRRIMQLEQELEAYQKKVGQLSLENDLLKKLHPNFQSTKNVSGFAGIARGLVQSKGRVR